MGCGSSNDAAYSAKNGNIAETQEFLKQVQLFKRLPADSLPALASAANPVNFNNSQVIIKQGDDGKDFYVIVSGQASVAINGKVLATLKKGDYFGENALLRDEPRNATITATAALSALKITRQKFQELGLHDKLEFTRRGAVGGGAEKTIEVKAPSKKTEADRKLIANALRSNVRLAEMVKLADAQIQQIIETAWKEDIAAGKQVITQGDLNADYFYVVADGTFDVTVVEEGNAQNGRNLGSVVAAAQTVETAKKGMSFGELALLYFAPRAATVTATVASVLWVIDRNNFKKILAHSDDGTIAKYVTHLDKVEMLKQHKPEDKKKIAEALMEMNFRKGEVVFNQGDLGNTFYVLIDGKVDVIIDGSVNACLFGSSENAHSFGEKALISKEPRAATIKVTSDYAKTLTLDSVAFDILLGKAVAPAAGGAKRFGNILRKDLKVLGLLGCGGFGAVEMVEHLPSGETYALKALSKGYVLKSGMQSSVMSEKKIQLMCDSPFVVKLYETFNGDQSLYLLLELALGGELYATYHKKQLFGKQAHAQFYIAGTMYAFEHLHGLKIIFRDLKPENLLLTDKGMIKLTDMGLAKVVAGKTYTTCGTPDYFSPEIIASKGHTCAVDWWTLGILTYELLSGHPPFEAENPGQIYAKVNKGIEHVKIVPAAKPAETLIKGLCMKEPADRLPMKKGGTDNIKKHPWFKGFDWNSMFNFTLTPPYLPKVKDKKDKGNFSARKEDMPPQVPYKDPGNGWDKDFATST